MLAMQAEAAEWQAKALRMEAEALKNAHKNDVLANSIRQAPAKSVALKPELLVVKEQPTEPEAHFRGTPPPWTAFAFIHDRYTGDGQCSGCSYEGQLMRSAREEPHCGWCWVDFCTKAGYNMSHIKKLDKLGVPAKEVKELDSAARSSKADPKPADSATGSSKTRPRLAIRLLGIPKRTLTDAGKKMEGDAGGKSKADAEAGVKKTKKADASEEEAGAKKTKETKREKVKGGKKKKTKKKQTSSSSSSTSSSSSSAEGKQSKVARDSTALSASSAKKKQTSLAQDVVKCKHPKCNFPAKRDPGSRGHCCGLCADFLADQITLQGLWDRDEEINRFSKNRRRRLYNHLIVHGGGCTQWTMDDNSDMD